MNRRHFLTALAAIIPGAGLIAKLATPKPELHTYRSIGAGSTQLTHAMLDEVYPDLCKRDPWLWLKPDQLTYNSGATHGEL